MPFSFSKFAISERSPHPCRREKTSLPILLEFFAGAGERQIVRHRDTAAGCWFPWRWPYWASEAAPKPNWLLILVATLQLNWNWRHWNRCSRKLELSYRYPIDSAMHPVSKHSDLKEVSLQLEALSQVFKEAGAIILASYWLWNSCSEQTFWPELKFHKGNCPEWRNFNWANARTPVMELATCMNLYYRRQSLTS